MNLHQPAQRQANKLPGDDLAERLAVEKFAIGQSLPRSEDPMLLRGEGRYTDDVSLPGQAYAVMVRSRNAHGNIRAIRLDAARSMPGVLGVYTAADLQAYGPLKCIIPFKNRDGSPMKKPLARSAGQGQSALCRRPGRMRRRRDGAGRQGCGRSGRDRHRAPPRGDHG